MVTARLILVPSLKVWNSTVWNSLREYLRDPVVGHHQLRRDLIAFLFAHLMRLLSTLKRF